MKIESDTPDSTIDPANVKTQAAEDLRKILKMAWRPAWSMRSRRGSLAPFIDWWRRRNDAAKKQ